MAVNPLLVYTTANAGVSTQLDVTTLLIGLAIIVFAVSLAQLVLLLISSHLKKKDRRDRGHSSDDTGEEFLV